MNYSPKPDNLRPIMITVLLTVISVSCFILAGNLPGIKWILQLLFVCLATAAIQIFMKYVLTDYEYVCSDDSLFIYKSLSRKKLLIGKLELINSASYVMSEKDYKSKNEDYKIKSSYIYTRNYKTDDVYIYVTTIGETNFLIKIEANNQFADYVNVKIDESLKGLKEQNNDEV